MSFAAKGATWICNFTTMFFSFVFTTSHPAFFTKYLLPTFQLILPPRSSKELLQRSLLAWPRAGTEKAVET